MSLDHSDLLLRAPSVEVVDVGNCDIRASSLLLLLSVEIVVGTVGDIEVAIERGIK